MPHLSGTSHIQCVTLINCLRCKIFYAFCHRLQAAPVPDGPRELLLHPRVHDPAAVRHRRTQDQAHPGEDLLSYAWPAFTLKDL